MPRELMEPRNQRPQDPSRNGWTLSSAEDLPGPDMELEKEGWGLGGEAVEKTEMIGMNQNPCNEGWKGRDI